MRRTWIAPAAVVAAAGFWGAGAGSDQPQRPLEAETLYGHVAIASAALVTPAEFRIGVAVDTTIVGDETPTADVLYQFQTTEHVEGLPQGLLRNVRVDYEPGVLQLTRAGESAPFLGLVVSDRGQLDRQAGTVLVHGFGLGRACGPELWSFPDGAFSQDLLQWLTYVSAAAQGECQAGGAGSLSCSIGDCCPEKPDPGLCKPNSCSVTCKPGYYACCNCTSMGARCPCKQVDWTPHE